jgi:predicted O-methyltransferase YrrM
MLAFRKPYYWTKQENRKDNSNTQQLYAVDYPYRESPLPRPTSNVSLGDVFAWFYEGKDFLPSHPHVNEVAHRCRTDSTYSGERPKRVTWSAERETGHALYSVIRLGRPKNVIEVGTYNGASTVSMAQALRDNGDSGQLHCVEIDQYNIDLTRHHLEEAGLAHLASLYQGSSQDPSLVDRLPESELIFIDGDHSYEGARHDYETFSKKLSPRGLMLYHDTIKIMALGRLMQEIAQSGDFDVFSMATSDGDGITFLRRRW